MGYLHLAAGRRDRIDALLSKGVTAVAYETIQNDDGSLPVQSPMSRLAGMMLPQVAGTLLQNDRGGKGILLSGLAGLPAGGDRDHRGWHVGHRRRQRVPRARVERDRAGSGPGAAARPRGAHRPWAAGLS